MSPRGNHNGLGNMPQSDSTSSPHNLTINENKNSLVGVCKHNSFFVLWAHGPKAKAKQLSDVADPQRDHLGTQTQPPPQVAVTLVEAYTAVPLI